MVTGVVLVVVIEVGIGTLQKCRFETLADCGGRTNRPDVMNSEGLQYTHNTYHIYHKLILYLYVKIV